MDGWNLASEILPEDGERVLTYCEYPVYGVKERFRRGITVGLYSNFTGRWETENFIGKRVIAWMRLPKSPEEV